MRILHVLDHSLPLHSGYTFRTYNILRKQRALGWQTAHVTGWKQGESETSEERIEDLLFYRTPANRSWLRKLPIVGQWLVVKSLAKRLQAVIATEQPDILHAHSPALNGLATLLANRKLRLPVVYECRAFWEDAAVDHGTSSEHGMRYRLTRALETFVFKKADAVTTICEGLRKDIIDRGLPEQNVTVIPNAVDTEQFKCTASAGEALARKLGLDGCIVLGFIGSFYAYEGIPLLLDAFAQVVKSHPNVRLLLVGGGPQENSIKEKLQTARLGEYVVMSGRVPHDAVQAYYDVVDIFVYPRSSMRLTELVTPLKPLEAMAQEKLVVASDVGGHRELIADGVTGRLFLADSAEALATALVGLLDAPASWSSFQRAGRQYVENERTWQISINGYVPVYESLVARKHD